MTRPKKVTIVPSSVVHTLEGMAATQDILIKSFKARYNALRYSMFRWEDASGKCDNMFMMSCGEAPEKYIIDSTYVAGFDFEGSTYVLPIVESYTPNIYGKPISWNVQGYGNELMATQVNNIPMNWENSCLCQDSLNPTQDAELIEALIMHMVDCLTTLHGRTLLARAPYIFYLNGMQDSVATSYMNAIASGSPFIAQDKFTATKPELLTPTVTIDSGLLDVISYYDSTILGYLGYNATDVYKRAQQSVPETNMTQGKIEARRKEKLRCRQLFCDMYNKKFGNQLSVFSVLDEQPIDIQPIGDYLNDGLGENGNTQRDKTVQ